MNEDEKSSITTDSATKSSITRRRVIGATAAGATGLGIGLAAGAVLGSSSLAPAPVYIAARRRFEGKVVLITGATSGIGRAAATQFAAEGGKVAFCGRREALGRTLEDEIRAAKGEAIYVRADVRVEKDVREFVERTVARYGRLDVAFNNAGITLEKPLHEYTLAEWDDIVNTNLRGVFLSMKYQIPYMLEGGGGNIVVTSSSNAIATTARRSAYTATKRALVGLVQSAALDYVARNIRINTLIPGTTDTPLVRRVAGMENAPDTIWQLAAAEWARSHIPLHRMATAQEVAAFALTLASDEHPFMTGAQMVIDGGKTAQAG
jgi:NAD(P)-dependent dehydrogenase (short-subunit alcohol dehydrogenase family)